MEMLVDLLGPQTSEFRGQALEERAALEEQGGEETQYVPAVFPLGDTDREEYLSFLTEKGGCSVEEFFLRKVCFLSARKMSQEEWICARNAEKLFIQAKKQVDAAVQLPKNLKDYLRKKRFRAGQKSAEFQCASATINVLEKTVKGRGAAEDSNAFTRSETSRQTEDTTADGSYLQNLWYNTTIESQENAKDGMLDLVDAKFHQLA